MTRDPAAEYRERYPKLREAAWNLAGLLEELLEGTIGIDRVSARAKTPESFEEKARKSDSMGGLRYEDPLSQIQDQIGARVIVRYKSQARKVAGVLGRYFTVLEHKEHKPESNWEFGYSGDHAILALPLDVLPQGLEEGGAPRFFELQIKTVFQHAWSEANHDLGYKGQTRTSSDQERRLAFTAAQAWGADRVFQELHLELRQLVCYSCEVTVDEAGVVEEAGELVAVCPSCGESMPLETARRIAREECYATEVIDDLHQLWSKSWGTQQSSEKEERDPRSGREARFVLRETADS